MSEKYHLIGIKGSGMSALAHILYDMGHEVQGSDIEETLFTQIGLEAKGMTLYPFGKSNIEPDMTVIIGNAFKDDHVEVIQAKQTGAKCVRYHDFLGSLAGGFTSIAISGTHGKTTTTSLVSLCFLEALRDPSIQVGAIIKELDGNYRVGNSENFIIEACEYVESFLKFSPKSEIILNIDNDHLDYYKNLENIKNAFIKYVKLLPEDGHLIINADDNNCLDLPVYSKAQAIKYGIENDDVDFQAKNIKFDDEGMAEFDVYKYNEFYEHISLSIPGKHNILNALACIALCDTYGISKADIKNAIHKFKGADRRFEFKGMLNGARVYDDYGHHPTEVKATAKALKNKKYNKSWVVFQPHTYSRTFNLLDDFANALLEFDNIIVTDIYAARETNTYNISSKDLVNKIIDLGKNAIYLPSLEECASYLKENVKKDDIIVVVRNGSKALIGKHAKIRHSMPNTVIGAFMTGIRSDSPDFINALLSTDTFDKEIKMNMGATINQITGYMFANMEFMTPSFQERQAVGSFFSRLDDLITLHQRKCDKYKSIKAGLIRKLFP